jgi:DNA invertase Pin-like site-specific DNA recombinase
MSVRETAIAEAAESLNDWATHRDNVDHERDQRVRAAYAAGMGKSRIAQLTGLARSTVERILREPRP